MTHSAAPSCLVAGSINIDEFYALPHIVRPGETISSTGFSRSGGGKGSNQAIAIGRACGRVTLDAAIGEDGRDILLPPLIDAGVQTDRVKVVDVHTGRAIIQLSQDGENSIVLFPGANHVLRAVELGDDVTHLVVQNEIPFEATKGYLAAARERGVSTVFNPSPMPAEDELRTFPWETVEWLLLNEGEAGDIAAAFAAGAGGEVALADAPAEATRALGVLSTLRSLPAFSTVNFVCTLGAAGVVVLQTNGKPIFRPAARLLNPLKDTTGAGDCFAGYFVAGLMRGDGMDVVVEEALAACSICVERPGAAISVPPRHEVLERMRA